jgi:hypothetical protein
VGVVAAAVVVGSGVVFVGCVAAAATAAAVVVVSGAVSAAGVVVAAASGAVVVFVGFAAFVGLAGVVAVSMLPTACASWGDSAVSPFSPQPANASVNIASKAIKVIFFIYYILSFNKPS